MSLIEEAELGDIDSVRRLLYQGKSVHDRDRSRSTALICAARCGHVGIVELLLQKGAYIDAQNAENRTALMLAALYGRCDVLELLLKRGARSSLLDKNKQTALMWAARKGHATQVEALLKCRRRGAQMCSEPCAIHRAQDLHLSDATGCTALIHAALNNHQTVVRALLIRGADSEHRDMDGRTALIWAAAEGNVEALQVLLEYGAEIDARDFSGRTALMHASASGHEAVVRFLLISGVEVAARDNSGWTALHFAVEHSEITVAEALLEVSDVSSTMGPSVLALAVTKATGELADLLLNHGAHIPTEDCDNLIKDLLRLCTTTPLLHQTLHTRLTEHPALIPSFIHIAVRKGITLFQPLLSMGFIEVTDEEGDSPLLLAMANGNTDLALLLIHIGVNIHYENDYGRSAISFAIERNMVECIQILQSKGAIITEESAENHFQYGGMTLSDMDEFIYECGGLECLEGKSTEDVCKLVVSMVNGRVSYCEHLAIKRNKPIPLATVFVSHAWKCHFIDVLDAIQNSLINDLNAIIWFDVFSVNQFTSSEGKNSFAWWSNVFKGAIRHICHIGKFIIVLSPWRDPLPLHRAWCVYEAYCAIDTKCTCEIAISNASRIDILNNIENAKEIIKYLLSNIDVRKCKASEEKDVRFILKTIEKYQGGAERINKKVRRLMSGGYKSVGL